MTKTLKLTSVSSTATTYSFRADDGDGWALCTINDATGELALVTDWGNWSYLWNPKPICLGNATLTHFIGERGSVDYLANKLLGRRGSERFSAEKTTAHFRAELVRVRFADGQEYNDRLRNYGDERDQESAIRFGYLDKKYNGNYYLTKGQARELWDDLGSLGSGLTNAELYAERFMQLDNHDSIFEEPWNEMQYEESHDSKRLRELILPALVAACGERVNADPHYLQAKACYLEKIAAAAAAIEASAKAVSP